MTTQSAASAGAVPERLEASSTLENRNATRHPAHLMPAIRGLRLKPYGAEATLVNISTSGVLAEGHIRLKPGNAVTVVFEGTFSPSSIEGRVVRASVASLGKDGVLRYHLGIAFNKAIALDDKVVAPADTAAVLADKAAVHADKAAVHADKTAVLADGGTVPADKAVVRGHAPAEATVAPERRPQPASTPAPAVLSNRW